MLLSQIRDLPYVEPLSCYNIVPELMTDEELEEMIEENENIISNALMSSVLDNLKWMSNGPFIY